MNLRTAVVCCKAALPALLESGHGRIINIGAGAAAARAGAEWARTRHRRPRGSGSREPGRGSEDRGITVNAILPGVMTRPATAVDMPDADFSRWVAPEAIAEVILFLASDAARAVTGASIPVFGRG